MELKTENPIFYVKYVCGVLDKILNISSVNNLYFCNIGQIRECTFFDSLKEAIISNNFCINWYLYRKEHPYNCDFEIISKDEYFKITGEKNEI